LDFYFNTSKDFFLSKKLQSLYKLGAGFGK